MKLNVTCLSKHLDSITKLSDNFLITVLHISTQFYWNNTTTTSYNTTNKAVKCAVEVTYDTVIESLKISYLEAQPVQCRPMSPEFPLTPVPLAETEQRQLPLALAQESACVRITMLKLSGVMHTWQTDYYFCSFLLLRFMKYDHYQHWPLKHTSLNMIVIDTLHITRAPTIKILHINIIKQEKYRVSLTVPLEAGILLWVVFSSLLSVLLRLPDVHPRVFVFLSFQTTKLQL